MIFAELERQGVANNTLIVLSSDNGGERYSDNAPLFNHKTTLWEGGIRVPCLMRWPAGLPKGKVSKQVGVTMDLTATFLAVSGAKPPAGYNPDGINLLPMLTGEKPEVERTLFWRVNRSNRVMSAARHGRWKYVNDGNTVEMLFDLSTDKGERHDLGYGHPEVLRDLKSRLKSWESEMDASGRDILVK